MYHYYYIIYELKINKKKKLFGIQLNLIKMIFEII
jgi:hypothetical protein